MTGSARTTLLLLLLVASSALAGVGGDERPAPPTPAATPSPQAAPAPRRADGGVAILASAAAASAVVTGTISHAKKIDLHGWSADLDVDEVLAGTAGLHEIIPIGWEELSPRRLPRFADGERVLVVLVPLPTQSLWRGRFPDSAMQAKVRVVANNSESFLLSPDGGTLNTLEHYLALAPAARDSEPGAERLAEFVANGHPALANEALDILEARSSPLGSDANATLLEAANDAHRETTLRARALALAAKKDSPQVRETARRLTEPGSAVRADAYLVLARLPGAIEPAKLAALVDAPEAELRVAGIHLLPTDAARERLPKLLKDDKDPAVRVAAAREMTTRFGVHAIPDVIACLDDDDPAVRNGAAVAIGSLGSAAVEPLREIVDKGSEKAALSAVLGLARSGKDGTLVLAVVSEQHPKESVRTLAKIAVGRSLGEPHEPPSTGGR